jgi:hypothetical protein
MSVTRSDAKQLLDACLASPSSGRRFGETRAALNEPARIIGGG